MTRPINPERVAQISKIIIQLKTKLRKRETTLNIYAEKLFKFSTETHIDLFQFKNLPKTTSDPEKQPTVLNTIEDLTESYINLHIDTPENRDAKRVIAPKTLNVIFCAVKAWTFVNGIISNRKQFREIDFDKQTRTTDAILEQPLEPQTVKALFEIANCHEKALLGVYGFNGLRPALIPQMRVNWIFPQHYKIENGVFKFTVKNPFFYIPKNLEGNKATGTTFFSIFHSKIATAIEQSINILNSVETITRDTPLIGRYDSKSNLSAKVRTLFKLVGFNGRPYLLRSCADYIYDDAGLKRESGMPDNDFKEQLMLHKGVISAIYQGKGLPESQIAMYTKMYQSVENWINEKIFGIANSNQLSAASQLALFAKGLGVNESQIQIMLEALTNGRTTYDKFNNDLKELTDKAFADKMSANMETALLTLMQKKGLIAPTAAALPETQRSA